MDPREIAVGQIWMVDWATDDDRSARERWVMVAWFTNPWTVGVVVASDVLRPGWAKAEAYEPEDWVREVPVGDLYRMLDAERAKGMQQTAWCNLREVLDIAEVRRLEEAAGMVVASQGAA